MMAPARRAVLARHIQREGRYPPLIVRPHPTTRGAYEVIDGHQRLQVLQDLGHATAVCYRWPCDDQTALLLLATLNRLEGTDLPGLRATLLAELGEMFPDQLSDWLPEDEMELAATLALGDLDPDVLLAELEAQTRPQRAPETRLLAFNVPVAETGPIEAAVNREASRLTGNHKKGRALAAICRAWLEARND